MCWGRLSHRVLQLVGEDAYCSVMTVKMELREAEITHREIRHIFQHLSPSLSLSFRLSHILWSGFQVNESACVQRNYLFGFKRAMFILCPLRGENIVSFTSRETICLVASGCASGRIVTGSDLTGDVWLCNFTLEMCDYKRDNFFNFLFCLDRTACQSTPLARPFNQSKR